MLECFHFSHTTGSMYPWLTISCVLALFYCACDHGRNFVIKWGGGQLDIKPIKSSGLCGSEIM